MTDESTPPRDGGDSAPLAGERLAAERQKQGIALHEVARQLHLDEYKVRALEENAFDTLGPPVFAKGYLRKYAELVGVPLDGILADYYRLNHSAGVPMLIARHREKTPRQINPGPWLAALVLVAITAGVAWWWLSTGADWSDAADPSAAAPVAVETVEQQAATAGRDSTSATSADGDAAIAPNEDEAIAQNEDVIGSGSSPGETERSPTIGSAPSAGRVGTVELQVSFSGDCWTEITDASGDRLFFGLGTGGRSVTVTGDPPLQVLLGDSANATLAVDGSSYPIPPSARRGDTARLTIASP